MTQGDKICVQCGQSCAGQARVKDAKGNYAHTACVEKLNRKGTQGGTRSSTKPEQAGSMAAILADIDEADMIGGEHSCQGCGYPMDDNAMICLNCGFNRETGREYNTRVGKDPTKKRSAREGESKLAEFGSDIASLGMAPIYPLIGGLIGGAIGAAIWAGLAYSTGYEFRIGAVVVGMLCGYGARLGGDAQTTGGGAIAGLMAGCMAILAIATGKYIALNMIFQRDLGGHPFEVQSVSVYDITDEDVLSSMTFELVREKIDAGEPIEWSDLALPIQVAEWPDDYPETFQNDVYDTWDSMSDSEQLRFRRDISNQFGLNSYRDVDVEWALQVLADEMAMDRASMGEGLEWPNPHLFNEAAYWPDDYSEDVLNQVQAQWDSMSEQERESRRFQTLDTYNEVAEELTSMQGSFTLQVVIESFKHPFQVMFAIFAVGTAFWVGNSDA